jgi:hypothetical protein
MQGAHAHWAAQLHDCEPHNKRGRVACSECHDKPTGAAASTLGRDYGLTPQSALLATALTPSAAAAAAATAAAAAAAAASTPAAERGATSPQCAGAAPTATVAVAVATSQQLGTPRTPLVPPYGAAALNNEAFAQRPPMPADPVGPAGAPAPPSAHGEASLEAAAAAVWMRQSSQLSQLPQRFNGPMFVTDAVTGKLVVTTPVRGGGAEVQASTSTMTMAPGRAGAAQMVYCGLPAPMVSVATAPPSVRVVCRGCGLVRMEVEGALPPPPLRPPPPPPQ